MLKIMLFCNKNVFSLLSVVKSGKKDEHTARVCNIRRSPYDFHPGFRGAGPVVCLTGLQPRLCQDPDAVLNMYMSFRMVRRPYQRPRLHIFKPPFQPFLFEMGKLIRVNKFRHFYVHFCGL